MAKTEAKKNSFGKGPWEMKKAELDTFIKVTEANRKQANVIGRIFYIIAKEGNKYFFGGTMTIDPCTYKGWWLWPWMPYMKSKQTHYKVYFPDNKSRDEWAAEYKALFDLHIGKEQLYINQSDPILTYIKET